MKKNRLSVYITLVMLLVFSLNTIKACTVCDEEEFYDCSIWSADDSLVNLGVSSWPLLDGTAEVTAYKLKNCLDCNSCCCCDECSSCICCDSCCIKEKCFLKQGILTHRGTRGLGVLGGSNNDEIDTVDSTEVIVVSFEEPQNLLSFEVRSLFIESYNGQTVYEKADVIVLLDKVIVHKYQIIGEEVIGTGNGAAGVSDINKCFDSIAFYVSRCQNYSAYSDFAVAKIQTSSDLISFVQPLVGVDCDNYVNQPPVANNDSYTVSEGEILTVNASEGVLINDFDPDGDVLTAVKLSEPGNGILVFNSDGSFTYTPDEDFSGFDSFTYQANDGADDSNIAVVKITIVDVMPSILVKKTSNPSVVVEPGSDVVFTVEIHNTGVEPVLLVSLVDDIFGDLNGKGSCVIPQIIPVDGCYICNFTEMVSGEAGDAHWNNVTAVVEDNEGNSASHYDYELVFIIENEESNIPPVADTGGPYQAVVNEVVMFNGSKSYDPDGIIVNFSWDFGDGHTATGIKPEHSYSTVGEYIVTLTVTDDNDTTDVNVTYVNVSVSGDDNGDDNGNGGSSSSKSKTKTSSYISYDPNKPPKAIILIDEPYENVVNKEITFNGSLSTADTLIVSYEWDLGDGTSATGMIITHSYMIPGTYTVTLTVKDDKDETDSESIAFEVIQPNRSPSLPGVITDSLTFDQERNVLIGNTKIKHAFNISSTDPDGDNIGYIVEWGDGTSNETDLLTSGTVASLLHSWDIPGVYLVNISAVDENGESSGKLTLNIEIIEDIDKPAKDTDFASWWLLLLAILITGLLLILFFLWKRKKDKKDEEA